MATESQGRLVERLDELCSQIPMMLEADGYGHIAATFDQFQVQPVGSHLDPIHVVCRSPVPRPSFWSPECERLIAEAAFDGLIIARISWATGGSELAALYSSRVQPLQ